jgi:hypothetical protein
VFDDPMPTQYPFQFSLMPSSMVRRSVLLEVGAFSERLRASEDLLVGWQVAARYRMAAVRDLVTRVHRTSDLAASSADLAGKMSPDYHRARVIGYSLLARSGRRGRWGMRHSDSVRRLCIKLSEQGEGGLRTLALQQFRHTVSPRAVLFLGAILFGHPGIRIWRWLTERRDLIVTPEKPIGIPMPKAPDSAFTHAGMGHD